MIALALAVVLAVPPCEHPALGAMSPEQQNAACALLAEPPPDSPVRLDALGAIYEREGFASARKRDTGALKALLAQLRAKLESLFESSGAETYSNATRVFVLVVGLIAAGYVALRFAARRRATREPVKQGSAATALELDDPRVHLGRARELLATDTRAAIREGLLALLSHLEQQRFARPDRVKTNSELTRELPERGAPPATIEAASKLLGWYDRAFYSLDPVDLAEAARFLDGVNALSGTAP